MTIKREINGEQVEIELTFSELRNAYEECKLDNYTVDFINKMKELADNGSIPLTPQQFESIPVDKLKEFAGNGADKVDYGIGKCDPYFEAFWNVVDDVLMDKTDWGIELPALLSA